MEWSVKRRSKPLTPDVSAYKLMMILTKFRIAGGQRVILVIDSRAHTDIRMSFLRV